MGRDVPIRDEGTGAGGGAARLRDAAIPRREQCLVRSDVALCRLNTEEALAGVCSRLAACLKTAF